MRKKKSGRTTAYSILALFLFAGLLAAHFSLESLAGGKQTAVYDIVVLGDSIFGQTRDESSIPAQLAALLDKKVYNGALGGTCMGRLEENIGGSRVKDVLSMVGLSKAIVSRDFRLQENLKIEDSGTEYFGETLQGLTEIDFSQVEVLLIGHGVNDYHAGERVYPESMGEDADVGALRDSLYDEYSFAGALCSAVTTLQKTYPRLRIILVTPTYTWYTQQGLTCEEYFQGGNILADYVEAELALAKALDIEVIDQYHGVYPHETWEDWKLYSSDGLHPNEAGRTLLAERIAAYLRQ